MPRPKNPANPHAKNPAKPKAKNPAKPWGEQGRRKPAKAPAKGNRRTRKSKARKASEAAKLWGLCLLGFVAIVALKKFGC